MRPGKVLRLRPASFLSGERGRRAGHAILTLLPGIFWRRSSDTARKYAAVAPRPPFGRRQELHLNLSLDKRSNRDLQPPNISGTEIPSPSQRFCGLFLAKGAYQKSFRSGSLQDDQPPSFRRKLIRPAIPSFTPGIDYCVCLPSHEAMDKLACSDRHRPRTGVTFIK